MNSHTISKLEIHKLNFISNALENGWSVKKIKDKYIFTKNHDNKKEVFLDNYLEQFIYKNVSTITINDV
tara:strand:- start:15585 stop:15791 length:207 start_codon:yes stop_codon:yes gene_type:complete